MEFLRAHQLSIMLYMSGICGVLAFMTLMARSLPRRRKCILALMELSAMLLLIADQYSYIYRGDASRLAFYMVRICNGLVFFFVLFIPCLVTQYLKDLYVNEGGLPTPPRSLYVCDALFAIGALLVLISQFTGLYYTFDANNTYQRAPGFVFSYAVPVLSVLLQESTIIRYRARLSRGLVVSLMLNISLPMVCSVLQIFLYGVSLTNMSMVFVVTIFYVYMLNDMSRAVETAREHELASYKASERREAALFEQTAEALAWAIDAKDTYTHGHSTRVAALSRRIADAAGYSEKNCKLVYFAALLHDVGKIGVPDDIIRKHGELTEEEFEQIKLHPVLGNQILSNIKQSPSLCIGAHYHHERFDGTGYPDGLVGEDIPEIARIIAVADAYDAMTSARSYRDPLPMEQTIRELIAGMGTQFDPRFAQIVLEFIESDEAKPDN